MLTLPSSEVVQVGVDEAGRGPLAFEVVSAAVIMPSSYENKDKFVGQIKDSKKLSGKKRDILAEYIKNTALAYGIGMATVQEIDRYNILNATYMAMHRALDQAYEKLPFQFINVDGNSFKAYIPPGNNMQWTKYECVIDGDNTYLNIAAASILAKTHRDNIVKSAIQENPDWDVKYGFSTNMGYGTAKHMSGLKQYGICGVHRLSFAPVAYASKHQTN